MLEPKQDFTTIIIISLQIYTYCTYYFGEDYLVVKTRTPGQYDI